MKFITINPENYHALPNFSSLKFCMKMLAHCSFSFACLCQILNFQFNLISMARHSHTWSSLGWKAKMSKILFLDFVTAVHHPEYTIISTFVCQNITIWKKCTFTLANEKIPNCSASYSEFCFADLSLKSFTNGEKRDLFRCLIDIAYLRDFADIFSLKCQKVK